MKLLTLHLVIGISKIIESSHEKTNVPGFGPGLTQTRLYS